METGTIIAIGVVAVGGIYVMSVIRENNMRAQERQNLVVNNNQSPLGETGGIIFGSLAGLASVIGSIGSVTRSNNTRSDGGAKGEINSANRILPSQEEEARIRQGAGSARTVVG